MKKKKKFAVLAIVALILCTAVTGTYLWYRSSPFPTVVKLMNAAKEKDLEAMLDCIEPDKAERIRWLVSLLEVDLNNLLDRMMSAAEESGQSAGLRDIKFLGYHRSGDEAYIEFSVIGSEDEKQKIDFIRIEGKWYLKLSFLGG